jgi:hypothetical protein
MSRKSLILILGSTFVISLSAFVTPYYVRARDSTASNVCVNSLRQIECVKEEWRLENKKTSKDTPTWDDIRPYIGKGPHGDLSGLQCQKKGTFRIGRLDEPPTCSIGGPNHSLYYDDSKERRYSAILGPIVWSSFIVLIVTFLFPKRIRVEREKSAGTESSA